MTIVVTMNLYDFIIHENMNFDNFNVFSVTNLGICVTTRPVLPKRVEAWTVWLERDVFFGCALARQPGQEGGRGELGNLNVRKCCILNILFHTHTQNH